MTQSQPAKASPHSVEASMVHLVASDEKPVIYADADPLETQEGAPRFQSHRVRVQDARPIADELSLDREGFALVHHDSKVIDFHDDDEVRARYYPEVERLIKETTGAAKVVIFDHTRRVDSGEPDRKDGKRTPVRKVHNDYTERSGPQRVEDLLTPGEAALWRQGRFAVINLWRSIKGAVEAAPLAIADAQSMGPGDFVAADLVYPDRTGEIYYVTENPAQRWYYFPKMAEDEVLLLKCYDSREDGVARFTAHTAFDDPETPLDAAPRESIEVRTLVLLEDPRPRFNIML